MRVRIDLGTDDTDLTNSQKVAKLQSVLYGGRTLRFAYAVTASDTDADGVWVQTGGSDQVVFLAGTPKATVTSPLTGVAADLTKAGLPTEGGKLEGAVRAKVDGSVQSSAGPTPTAAEVNGATLTVTFDEAISWTSDEDLSMSLSVQNTGDENGGNRNAYQHPIALAHGDTTNKLVLTLGYPAKASDTVTLSHHVSGAEQVLQDTSGNAAAAFLDLAVTNVTPGVAGPVPVRAEVGGKELRIVFDSALDSGSAPAGGQFKVQWGNNNLETGRLAGTGTATVSGRQVRVTLNGEVAADALAKVSYDKPASNPLRASATGNPQVEAFDTFRIETVRDVKAPSLSRIISVQTSTGPPTASRILIYFDEPLDTSSKPAGGDFAVTVGSAAAVSPADSGVLIENTVVILALSGTATMTAGTTQVKVVYTPGTNPIRDLAGNEAAAIDDTRLRADTHSGKPSPLVFGVSGTGVAVTFSNKLWPGSIPDRSRFSLRYPHDTTLAYANSITAVQVLNTQLILTLAHPVHPCAGTTPVSLKYDKPTGLGANALEGFDGSDVDSFTRDLTNNRANECVDGWVRGMSEGSVIIRASRPFAKNRGEPKPEWFTVSASGGPVTVTGAAFDPNDAHVLKLELSREFAAGETVTASYRRPQGESGLWNVDGKQLADVVDWPVTVRAREPALSVADASGTEGGTLAFAVTLDVASTSNVTVDYATADGSAASAQDYAAVSGDANLRPRRDGEDGRGPDPGGHRGRERRDPDAVPLQPLGSHARRQRGDRHCRGRGAAADGVVPRPAGCA